MRAAKIMGVLSRRRSLLVKLVVVVTTAWFTIAFLLYSENQTRQAPVALPLQSAGENLERFNEVIEATEKLEVAKRKEEDVGKKEANSAVLAPPQSMAGEMGKPVILPSNLTGEFGFYDLWWYLEVLRAFFPFEI